MSCSINQKVTSYTPTLVITGALAEKSLTVLTCLCTYVCEHESRCLSFTLPQDQNNMKCFFSSSRRDSQHIPINNGLELLSFAPRYILGHAKQKTAMSLKVADGV